MDFESLLAGGGLLIAIGIALAALLVIFIVGFIVYRSWVKVARADEALVISGSKRTDEDAVKVVVKGRAVVNPMKQRYETISLRSRQVLMNVEAQSLDNVTLDVQGVAIVKIGSTASHVSRASERFASQDEAIELFTTEQLEGALRGVIATLQVTELMRERKKFADQIAQDISTELEEQGLILDSFQIKGITDNVGYIKSLGAPEIEAKRQSAEIAGTNAERAIRKQKITNDEANLIEQTEYDKNTALSKSEIGKANANAEQAEALARSQAEQGVLQQEAENKQAKLDAEVKRVADARLYEDQKAADADAYRKVKASEAQAKIAEQEAEATRVRANADAEAVRVQGQAKADSIRAEAEALSEHREALLAQRVIESLPELMREFARGYESIGNVSVVSSNGSGAGDNLAAENATALRSVFDTVEQTTGLNLREIIQGRAVGQAIGESLSQSDVPAGSTVVNNDAVDGGVED